MAAPAETRPTAEQEEEQFAVDDAPLAKAEKKSEGEKAEENHSHPKPESSMGSKKSIAKELKSFNAEGNEPAVKTGKRKRETLPNGASDINVRVLRKRIGVKPEGVNPF